MIILCNEDQYEKKKLKNVHKIIVSDDLESIPEEEKITHMRYLMPEFKLMNKYYADEISLKKYRKKYFEYLECDQIYATLLTLLLSYKKEKMLCIVCSKQERTFLYIQFLLQYIHENFGVYIIDYSKWKDKGFPKKFNIFKDYLIKRVNKYKHIIFEDEIKENKKKSKKKNKNKDNDLMDLPDMDFDKKIKRVKIKRT